MGNGEWDGEVDEAVEPAPVAAEAADRAGGRCRGERDEQQERREADRDVRPFGDVLDDVAEREELVEHHVGEEVQHGVGEGEQPERAAELHGLVPAGQPPDGRHRQRDEQQDQGPAPGAVRDFLDRGDAEPAGVRVVRELRGGREAQQPDQRFDDVAQHLRRHA